MRLLADQALPKRSQLAPLPGLAIKTLGDFFDGMDPSVTVCEPGH